MALVDTLPEPMLTHVRVLPPDMPYPHWLLADADAGAADAAASTVPANNNARAMNLVIERNGVRALSVNRARTFGLLSPGERQPAEKPPCMYPPTPVSVLDQPSSRRAAVRGTRDVFSRVR